MGNKEIVDLYRHEGMAYLNNAGAGILSEEAVDASDKFRRGIRMNGSATAVNWIFNESLLLKKEIGTFVGATVDQIALIPNFSTGLNFFLAGVDKSHNILLYKNDYPSLVMPFELRGYNITWLDHKDDYTIDMNDIEKAFSGNNISILAISHIQYSSGFKIDLDRLAALCKQFQVTLIVDGTQSIGSVNFNFENSAVDVMIWSNYKWMNGGFGNGVMCIRNEVLEKFPPAVAGFGSYIMDNGKLKYEPSAKSFEPGQLNMSGFEMLRVALKHKMAFGLAEIEKHIQKRVKELVDGLCDLDINVYGGKDLPRSGVVCFEADESLMEFLDQNGVKGTYRFGHIRLSPHYYNTSEDNKKELE